MTPAGPSAAGVDYDPFSPQVMRDPFPVLRRLRAEGRAHRLERYDAWALPRFADVWDVLADRDSCSIVEGPVFHREVLERRPGGPPAGAFADRAPEPLPTFASLDPPAHTEVRRAMADPFRPAAVARLEAWVQAAARARLDALVPAGRFDVVADYAAPVACATAARLLGLDDPDVPHLVGLVHRFVRRDPGVPGVTADGRRAYGELDALLLELVRARRARPATPPGLVEALLAAEVRGRRLTAAEVSTQLLTLFVGATETVPKVVAGGLLRLRDHPDQRRALVADPELAGPAFDEMLRLDSPLQFVGRTLVRDRVVAGRAMAAGQRLLLLLLSANRDEREFPDPERFDVLRRAPRHLGLGHGAHFCIGAHVARLEGMVLVRALLARLPDHDVDDAGVQRPPSEFQLGCTALPVVFDPLPA